MNTLREHAERLVRDPVRRSDLALVFDETVASTAEVHVEAGTSIPRCCGTSRTRRRPSTSTSSDSGPVSSVLTAATHSFDGGTAFWVGVALASVGVSVSPFEGFVSGNTQVIAPAGVFPRR
jgi:hypothetical protein